MTDPVQGTSNPPNPQPPHADSQPEQRTPVYIQPQQPDRGLIERLDAMGQTLAALPEQLVNGVREATQPQQTPQPPPSSGGSGAQQPGSNLNPTETPNEPTKPKQNWLVRNWFGGGK